MEEKPKKFKGHRCYFCGQRFLTINILRKHVNIHKDRDLPCEICGKLFSSSCGLKKHLVKHKGERPYLCEICGKSFFQKSTLQQHTKSCHSEQSYPQCKTCGKRLTSIENLQCWLCKYEERPLPEDAQDMEKQYIISNESSNSVSSDIISYDDKNEDAYNVITTSVECIISSDTGTEKNFDESTSSMKQNLQCLVCQSTFSTVSELQKHNLSHNTDDQTYACSVCGAVFQKLFNLKVHFAIHEDRKYVCRFCGKKFKTNVGLKQHLYTHSEDRPFICKSCPSTFKRLINLKQHILIHSENRPFVCKECGGTYVSLQKLKTHVFIVHAKEKLYKCDRCEREFNHSGNYKRHYRTHTGERPYKCDICAKTFVQITCLRAHEKIHAKSQEKCLDNVCAICGKNYKSIGKLKEHMEVHMGEIEY